MGNVTRVVVRALWDPDANVWFVQGSNVPGLVTEAPTKEILKLKLQELVPALLELNDDSNEALPVSLFPVDLRWKEHELLCSGTG